MWNVLSLMQKFCSVPFWSELANNARDGISERNTLLVIVAYLSIFNRKIFASWFVILLLHAQELIEKWPWNFATEKYSSPFYSNSLLVHFIYATHITRTDVRHVSNGIYMFLNKSLLSLSLDYQ